MLKDRRIRAKIAKFPKSAVSLSFHYRLTKKKFKQRPLLLFFAIPTKGTFFQNDKNTSPRKLIPLASKKKTQVVWTNFKKVMRFHRVSTYFPMRTVSQNIIELNTARKRRAYSPKLDSTMCAPIMVFEGECPLFPRQGTLWHLSRRSWPLSIRSYWTLGVNLSAPVSSRAYRYRSQSALRQCYRASRRNYRPLLEPEWLETMVSITCPLQVYALPLEPDRISRISFGRLFLIGWCWLNVFQYAALSVQAPYRGRVPFLWIYLAIEKVTATQLIFLNVNWREHYIPSDVSCYNSQYLNE